MNFEGLGNKTNVAYVNSLYRGADPVRVSAEVEKLDRIELKCFRILHKLVSFIRLIQNRI